MARDTNGEQCNQKVYMTCEGSVRQKYYQYHKHYTIMNCVLNNHAILMLHITCWGRLVQKVLFFHSPSNSCACDVLKCVKTIL